MDQIILSGVKPYDGRYPLELGSEFTTREWGWIKKHAGYLPATLDDNSFSDPELVAVLAIIVLHRAGRIQPSEVPDVMEKFADAPFGTTITIEAGEPEPGEGDAGPPDVSSSSSNGGSGDSSKTSSETSPPIQAGSGTTGSDTSRSDPATLVT